jgi:hypothetical protein
MDMPLESDSQSRPKLLPNTELVVLESLPLLLPPHAHACATQNGSMTTALLPKR